MHDVLSLFKRNINQLFGITVDILNVGRSLQQLSLSMQILANNGVVQAAKIPGGKGRPMLAPVSYTHLDVYKRQLTYTMMHGRLQIDMERQDALKI